MSRQDPIVKDGGYETVKNKLPASLKWCVPSVGEPGESQYLRSHSSLRDPLSDVQVATVYILQKFCSSSG